MNTAAVQPDTAVFMDSGFRRNDEDGTLWDRAVALFERAQAALDAAAHTPDEDLYDRLGIRHDRAMRRLLRTPAPHLPALAAKLEFALDERSGEFFGDSADMEAIKSDARRRASPAESGSH
ncbi:MAG: hypothetical protein ACXW27_15375 [Allosphingosinicella sp.]